jgi:hypothetical protein
VKVRQAGRIVSVAVIVAVGVNADGRREVLGDYRKFRVRAMTMRSEETSHGTTQATDDSRRHS